MSERQGLKRAGKWALIALAVLIGLIALALGLLSNRTVSTHVAELAVARFDKQIPAKVAFSHLSVNPLNGHVAVDDLALTIPGRPQEKFLTSHQVILDLDVPALVTGRVHLRSLHLVNPEATIIHRGNNHYNFEEILPKQKPDQPEQQASYSMLDRVTLEGGTVAYFDAPRDVSAQLPHLDASLNLDLPAKRVAGQVTTNGGWARVKGEKQPLDSFLADFKLEDKDLQLSKLKVDLGASGLAMSGRLSRLGTPKMAIALDGLLKGRLAQWARLAKQPITGTAQVDFHVTGTADAPRIGATVSGQAIGWRDLRVDRLSTRVVATRRLVTVDALEATLWGGRLAGSAEVPLVRGERLRADLAADGLEIGRAAAQLPPAASKGLKGVSGVVSARVKADGRELTARGVTATGWLKANGRVPVARKRVALAARTDFRWDGHELAVSRIEAATLGGRLTGQGRVTPLAASPAYAFEGTVSRVALAEVESLTGKVLPVSGLVSGTVRVAGRDFKHPVLAGGGQVAATGALKPRAAGNRVAVPFDATAQLAFTGKTLTIKQSAGRLLGGTVAAAGTVGLGGAKPAMHLAITARHLDVAAANRAFALAKGPVTGRADARMRLDDEVLTIDASGVDALGGHVAATGRVLLGSKPAAYALHVDARGIDVAAASRAFRLARVPVTGRVAARLDVTGAGPRFRAIGPVEATGQARVPDELVKGATRILPFRLHSNVAAGPRSVRLNPLEARIGGSVLTARGVLDLDGRSDLRVTGRVTDAPAIASIFGVRGLTGGSLELQAQASGQAKQLRFGGRAVAGPTNLAGKARFESATLDFTGDLTSRLHVTGKLAMEHAVSQGQPITSLSAPFSYEAPAARLAAGRLRMDGLLVQLIQGRLAGRLSYDLAARRYDTELRTQGTTLGDLQALRARAADGLPLTTPVSLQLKGAGSIASPSAVVNLTLAPFVLRDQSFGPSKVDGTLAAGGLKLNAALFARQLTVDGQWPVTRGPAGKLVLHFNNARLAPVFALVPASATESVELPLDGAVAGTVTITGPLTAAALKADVDLSRLRVDYRDLTIENAGAVELAYADRRLAIRQLHLRGAGTDLTAQGAIGLGSASDLRLDGKVNLALLEKVAPKNFADSAGTALLEAQLRGTFGRPDLIGALTIRNGELSTRNLPQTIRDLNASLRLDRDRLFVDSMHATLGYTGQLEATGGATLGTDFMPKLVDMHLTAREVAVRVPDVSVLMNADIGFSGRPDASRLDGQVRILEGKYTRNIPLAGGLAGGGGGGRAGAAATSAYATMPFLKNLAMQLQVIVPDQFVVRNNLADAELRGDLLVLGTLARPIPVGRVETIAGKITFQDRVYQVQEGTVDFIDPTRMTPYTHLVATTTIQGYDVRLQANGTVDALKLDLSSVPALPQSDVLTLIATGQTRDQLSEGGGDTVGVASNFLLNQVAKGVERGVTDQGVVDVLRIQPGSVKANDTTAGSVTVGKRVSEKLMITYTQNLTMAPGKTPGRLIVFDYLLTDNIVLKLEQDLGGGFNASARYRFTVR